MDAGLLGMVRFLCAMRAPCLPPPLTAGRAPWLTCVLALCVLALFPRQIQFDGLEARQLALASFALLCALCVRHGTYTVLRVPLLVTVSCLILIDLACYGLVRMAVKLVEWVWVVGYKRRDQRMRRSTYTEWVESGSALDKLERLDLWKEDPESRAYNWRQVQAVTRRLRDARERAQGLAPSRSRSAIFELESLLLPTLVKNYAGVGSAELYLKTHVGTKRCVEEYIDEVRWQP